MTDNFEKTSKFLCLVLRHDPQCIGLTLDASGWASVPELLRCVAKSKRPQISPEKLRQVVAADAKGRFALSADGSRIRANYGHSVAIEMNLSPSVPPDKLYHGTALRFVPSIRTKGLEKRSRNHVHMTASMTEAHSVGKRHGIPVLLEVNTAAMQQDGHVFYMADNGTWLVDTVPPEYLIFPVVQRSGSSLR